MRAIAKKMMRHNAAASFDGTPRRSNHSNSGTNVMAMTKAAVTGRKNSAPDRSAKGSEMISPTPAISVSDASSRSRLAMKRSAS